MALLKTLNPYWLIINLLFDLTLGQYFTITVINFNLPFIDVTNL
jgi:hypothetical protein